MPAPELGTKQVCPTCQSKFYDLQRRPAHCPKCGTDFDPEEALRSRRVVRGGRVYEADDAEDQVKAKSEDAEDEEEEEAATPEIDAAPDEVLVDDEDDSGDGAPAPAEELGVDLDEEADPAEDDAVPFLEDEDDEEFDDEIGLPAEGDADER